MKSGLRRVLLAWGVFVAAATAAEPTPVNVRTAPGRFDIAAVDASIAHAMANAAEEAWRWLAGPLALPDSFPTPVYVRVAAGAAAPDEPPFRVVVEHGGIVSVQLFAEQEAATRQRALVQGLLLRLAVARHGVNEKLRAPLWLEMACVGWWRIHADGAQGDALRHEARTRPAPPLEAVLDWTRGDAEPRELADGACWLLIFLQAESGRAREWPALLPRLLGGEDAHAALAAAFPGRFADEEQRELWWTTGYHHARRIRALPALESADSRVQLGALARFVFAAAGDDADQVLSVRAVLAHGGEPIVAAELARRRTELERLIPVLHPFYRNAGLSLGEALRAAGRPGARREAACAAFEQDWNDAVELEAAARAALDRLEVGR